LKKLFFPSFIIVYNYFRDEIVIGFTE